MKYITLSEAIVNNRKRLKEIAKNIPEINWEILKYANTHSKEEVLLKYPEQKEFIDTIKFD